MFFNDYNYLSSNHQINIPMDVDQNISIDKLYHVIKDLHQTFHNLTYKLKVEHIYYILKNDYINDSFDESIARELIFLLLDDSDQIIDRIINHLLENYQHFQDYIYYLVTKELIPKLDELDDNC